jgi:hypothetical protein
MAEPGSAVLFGSGVAALAVSAARRRRPRPAPAAGVPPGG